MNTCDRCGEPATNELTVITEAHGAKSKFLCDEHYEAEAGLLDDYGVRYGWIDMPVRKHDQNAEDLEADNQQRAADARADRLGGNINVEA